DDGGDRVGAEIQPRGRARGDGDDVLQRAGYFDADDVVAAVDPECGPGEGGLPEGGVTGVVRRDYGGRRKAADDLPREVWTGDGGDTVPSKRGQDFTHTKLRGGLEAF